MQNIVGIAVARTLGAPDVIGIICGALTLTGGPATGMAIADIFDALVAWDRPYKKAVPVERALGILRDEAGTGKLDSQILELFIDAKIYEKTLPRTGAEAELAR